MSIPLMDYGLNPTFSKISHRFWDEYRIAINDYILSMEEIGERAGEGIWFVPNGPQRLVDRLNATGRFQHDNRRDPTLRLAARYTRGEGYREIGSTSLHCEIADDRCNIHIDSFGFVWRGPDGKTYVGPDSIRHIVDDLGWSAIVTWVRGKDYFLGKILERVHPVVPSMENKFIPQLGIDFDLLSGNDWSLELEYHYGCTDDSCKKTEQFTGLTFTLHR